MELDTITAQPKMDRKDSQILLELDNDATQSNKKIGRKIRASKEVVAYRIKRLEDKGLIKNYLTVAHFSKIGLKHFKLYIKFSHITNEKKQEIIDYILKEKHVGWLASTEGNFDLMLAIRFRDIFEFERFKDDLFTKFDKYFQRKSFGVLTEAETYPRTYFLSNERAARKVFSFCNDTPKENLDKNDIKIIKALSENSRLTATEIAKRTGLSERVVRYRKKQLERRGVLVGYKLALDYRKMNYVFFKCLIKFQGITKERMDELRNYARMHPNVVHWLKVLGEWDLELELEAPSLLEFYRVANEFKIKFNDVIQTFDASLVSEEHAIKHA